MRELFHCAQESWVSLLNILQSNRYVNGWGQQRAAGSKEFLITVLLGGSDEEQWGTMSQTLAAIFPIYQKQWLDMSRGFSFSSHARAKTTFSHKVRAGLWQVDEEDGASQRICVYCEYTYNIHNLGKSANDILIALLKSIRIKCRMKQVRIIKYRWRW